MLVTNNILCRTFMIRGADWGTAFTLDIDGVEYLVTARHLLRDDPESLEVFHAVRLLEPLAVELVGQGGGEVDIAVFRTRTRMTKPGLPVTPTIKGLAFGQDVHFLGFPYKNWTDVGTLFDGWPLPWIKKGTVASYKLSDPQVIHLDAINNEGFSGGPVFFYPPASPRAGCVAGVVSKYLTGEEPVLDGQGTPTGMTVPYNTGFLVAYGIQHVLDLVARDQTRR